MEQARRRLQLIKLLIGNAATSILQSPNLVWDITTNTLSATNFVGSGAGLTSLNTSNVTLGTLSISRGGIGTTTLTANQILIGNAATSILQSPNLAWNNTSNTFSVSNLQMAGQIKGISTLSGTTGLFGTISTSNNTNVWLPSVGVAGGTGDKLMLAAEKGSIYPYSSGIDTNALWYSVSSGASHIKYINGTAITTIRSTGLSATGIINATSNLQETSINLSSKYLLLSSGAMTGQITGVTTLSGTTGLFGTVSTTNNTNVGLPSLGVSGGTGDKLILSAGTASIYPYFLGINSNSLWYSALSGASHNFYNNGLNTLSVSSTGLTVSGTTTLNNNTSINGFLT